VKKLLIVLLGMAVVVSFATVSFAGIGGTAHDLAQGGQGICEFCHTPHDPTSAEAPLWNHQVRAQAGFTMYDSSYSITMDMTVESGPTGKSLLCLSCHDGVTNVDAFGGNAGTGNMTTDTDYNALGTISRGVGGTDLTDDHPISVTYDTGQDPLFNATSTAMGGKTIADWLDNSRVECSTCHEPHSTVNQPFLRESNAASALCLKCHNK
jgi:predicted CXXCH cytochrome family protein